MKSRRGWLLALLLASHAAHAQTPAIATPNYDNLQFEAPKANKPRAKSRARGARTGDVLGANKDWKPYFPDASDNHCQKAGPHVDCPSVSIGNRPPQFGPEISKKGYQ